MTSVKLLYVITFLTIGIVLLKGISCGSFKELKIPKRSPPPIDPELPTLPALPGRPDLLVLPALPERPDLSVLPALPIRPDLPALPALPKRPDLPALPALPERPNLPALPGFPGNMLTLPALPDNPTTETTASAVKNQTLSKAPSGISTPSRGTVSYETSTMLTPKISTRIYPETQVPEISTTLSPATGTPEIPTAVAPETSVTSFTETEATETSTASFIATKAPDTSTTLFPATKACETSTMLSSTTAAPEPSTISVIAIEAPAASTSLPVTVEAPETSTITTVTPEDNTTASLVDPAELCPNNQSLISERDLETIVKNKINNLNLTELLNEYLHVETISIKDTIKEELQQFLIWFEDRPTHVKHILEQLTKIRSEIEKNVRQQTDKLQEYTRLENEYNAKSERLRKLSTRIEKYKHFCKLNCESDPVAFAIEPSALISNHQSSTSKEIKWPWKTIDEPEKVQSSDSHIVVSILFDQPEERGLQEKPTKYTRGGKYYCSNIDAVGYRIENILLHNLNVTKDNFKNKISRDSKMYEEKLEDFKRIIKATALSQFDTSMYDILNLQDQYHHFDELLKTDVHNYIARIKRQFAIFESIIMDLEVRAERLRKYCSTCILPLRNKTKETDLVEYVTNKIYDTISRQFFADYHNLFNELEVMFEEWQSNEEKITNLKPIQEEIASMTAQETEELNKLKEAFPKNSIASIVELEQKAKELNDNVNAMEKELAEK